MTEREKTKKNPRSGGDTAARRCLIALAALLERQLSTLPEGERAAAERVLEETRKITR